MGQREGLFVNRSIAYEVVELTSRVPTNQVSEAKRLKAMESENARLKKLLADAMLDNAALKDLLAKNVWSAPSVQGSWIG